jgi:uncharacterized protein (DUF952 family)
MGEHRTIYRLLAEDAWHEAEQLGCFLGSEHDRRDGFIHFSSAAQVAETAARHYAGQRNLLLLAVDAAALGPVLRWEPSRGGALFPHLYGSLPLTAVLHATRVELGADGRHVFPDDLP